MTRTFAVLAFFFAAILAGFFVRSTLASVAPATKEAFIQKDRSMPLDMEASGVMAASPILGSQPRPLSTQPFDMTDDDKISTFADNRQDASCYGSPFSGDGGYVCLTDADRDTMIKRGGNRSE